MSEGEREGREEEEGEVHFEGGGGDDGVVDLKRNSDGRFFVMSLGAGRGKVNHKTEITRRAAMTHVVVSVRAIVCG